MSGGGNGYRADIDGLRAFAILPVLLFHAGIPGFSGGYVGVDIFFVISGYLISGIIAREIDAGRFSILNFYERRARRIMPALLTMIAAVLAAGWLLSLPEDLVTLSRSAVAAILFVSNIFFFADVGYFAGAAETKPLLHTWSLAVEEQFYIGFPILLALCARFLPRRRTAVVAGVAMASFAILLFTAHRGDGSAFYLLPARAWELFVGGLLALGAVPDVRMRAVREAVSVAGLTAIGYAVFVFDRSTVFPSAVALFPVLGAAALIHCAPGTLVGRLLATRPFVAIGLISYSLYLWHWPLIVFTAYATGAPLTGGISFAVIIGSLLLATLSWRFVEQPFRTHVSDGRARLFAGTGAAMASLCIAALAFGSAGGWPGRFSPEVVRLAAAAGDVSPMRDRCHDSDAARGRPPCVLGATVPPTALLWGDSHGVELAYALGEFEKRAGRSLVQRTQSSCPPVIGYDPPGDPRCKPVNDAVLAAIRADSRIETIYLAGFWANGVYGTPTFVAEFDQTIAALVAMKRKVVIFGPVPGNHFDVPHRLALLARVGRLAEAYGSTRAELVRKTHWMEPLLVKWQGRGVSVIDIPALICGTGDCVLVHNDRPLYFDGHHLSLTGARWVIDHAPRRAGS